MKRARSAQTHGARAAAAGSLSGGERERRQRELPERGGPASGLNAEVSAERQMPQAIRLCATRTGMWLAPTGAQQRQAARPECQYMRASESIPAKQSIRRKRNAACEVEAVKVIGTTPPLPGE